MPPDARGKPSPARRADLASPSAVKTLAHSTARASTPRTRVLLVRQPVRPARVAGQHEALWVRLALGTLTAVAVLAAVWLAGHLGFRMGFAPAVRLSHELDHEPTGGLVTGVMIILAAPRVVLAAGILEPGWLMLGFAAIAVPAAGLSGARPRTPGTAPARPALGALAVIGAAGALLNAGLLIWWSASPLRHSMLAALPAARADAAAWADRLDLAAGMDLLAVVAGGLWTVLALRLPVPLWLKVLAGSAAIFGAAVAALGMAMSNGAAAHVRAPREVCHHVEGSVLQRRLLLGSSAGRLATLHVESGTSIVELTEGPPRLAVTGMEGVVEYLHATGGS